MKTISRLVITLIILLQGCSSSSDQKTNTGHFRIASPQDPFSLDPRKVQDVNTSCVLKIIFDGLTRVGFDGEPLLSLADDVKIEDDGKRYTFHLKESIWSDGSALTAGDFEETWKTSLKPDYPSYLAHLFYVIKNARLAKEGSIDISSVGVKALDDRTLEITLEYPAPNFLKLISSPVFYPYPQRIAEKNNTFMEKKKGHFVSNGPFLVKEWKPYDKLTFRQNATYWDKDAVHLKKITLHYINDQNTELALYEQNLLDWAGSPLSILPSDALPSLEKNHTLHSYPIAGVYFYTFNTTQFPFNNAKIRKALSYAIQRDDLITHVAQSDFIPAYSFIPPILAPHSGTFFSEDKNFAKKMFHEGLKELGLTEETFPKITINYNNQIDLHGRVAQAIQQQWHKTFGIQSELESKEFKVYLQDLTKGQFSVARLGLVAVDGDPLLFLDVFTQNLLGTNYSKWINGKFIDLVNQAKVSSDLETRQELIFEAEKLLMQEMPIAPLFFYRNSYLKKDYVHDVILSDLGDIDLKWAYLDDENIEK